MPVRLLYRSASAEQGRWREVEPLGLRLSDEDVYLLAYLPPHAEPSVFRLSRVAAYERTEAVAEREPPADIDAIFDHSVRMWVGEPVEVAVRLDASVAHLANDFPLHHAQTVTPEPSADVQPHLPGQVVVRARVAGVVEATRWVLSWGDKAEALEPKALRQALAQALHAAAARYQIADVG